jgi:hypothetical protein
LSAEEIAAALLWAAQGSIMMAYPLEKDKGRSFALFWCLFQVRLDNGWCVCYAEW